MRPVDQTRFGYPEGNCLTACLASYFECALSDLPDLNDIELGGGDWWKAICDICGPRGVRIMHALASWFPYPPQGLHLQGGKSPRGEFGHVVLVQDGVMVHDPHPSRRGLAEVRDYYLLIPMAVPTPSLATLEATFAVVAPHCRPPARINRPYDDGKAKPVTDVEDVWR